MPHNDELLQEAAIQVAELELLESQFEEGIRSAIVKVRSYWRDGEKVQAHVRGATDLAPPDTALKKLSQKFDQIERNEGEYMDAALLLLRRISPRAGAWVSSVRTSAGLMNSRIYPVFRSWRRYRTSKTGLTQREKLWAVIMAIGPQDFETHMDAQIKKHAREGKIRKQQQRDEMPKRTPPQTERKRFDHTSGRTLRVRKLPSDDQDPGLGGGGFNA